MPSLAKFVSRVNFASAKVDREKGIIYGVSLCSVGEAKGHDLLCDNTTLEQLRDCAKEYKSGLRVRFNPNTFSHSEGTMPGFIPADTIKIKGDQLLGDLHTYKNAPRDAVEFLYELAERSPDLFGLSVEFSGVPEEKGEERFARCDEILAAQVVDLPAANPTGLFSADSAKKPYGDVEYADPGFQEDGKKRYPIDTEEHVRSAWSYINKESNASEYSSAELSKIKSKIKAAAKKHGVEISEDHKQSEIMTPEEITKLALAISAPIVKALEPVIEFAKKKPADDDNEPTDEELKAAGVEDDDDEATKKSKMKKYRGLRAKKIETVGDVFDAVSQANMQFFRKTGQGAARGSGGGEGVNGDKDGPVAKFEALIAKEMEDGAGRPRAIMLARKRDPKAFNAFKAAQHGAAKKEEK